MKFILLALIASIVSLSEIALAQELSPDACFPSLGGVDFREHNPSAAKSFEDYNDLEHIKSNRRGLEGSEGYNVALADNPQNPIPLNSSIPQNGVVVDVGSGHSVASQELVQARPDIRVVSINTQDPTAEIRDFESKSNGQFEYRKGYAEEILRSLRNSADRIFDVFGAYTYSIAKVVIVELMFNALKPGGEARIYITKSSQAYVIDPEVRLKFVGAIPTRTHLTMDPGMLPLHLWLVKRFPDIFTFIPREKFRYSYTTGQYSEADGVLIISKNFGTSASYSLDLGLDLLQIFSKVMGGLAPEISLIPRSIPDPHKYKNPRR